MDYEKNSSENTAVRAIMRMIEDGEISQDVAKKYYPEFVESEDERIRKALIEGIKICSEENILFTKEVSKSKVLSWLEKQCDRNISISNVTLEEFQDAFVRCAKNYEIDLPRRGYDIHGLCLDLYTLLTGKKPADNVEPKFKVGDWIIHTTAGFVYKIQTVGRGGYGVISRDDKKFVVSRSEESSYHLWTIEDAKPGDVLAAHDEEFTEPWIGMFKRLSPGYTNQFDSYCFLGALSEDHEERRFTADESICFHTAYGTVPATKEEQEMLFRMMADAGYEWDADKLELKKIGQISAELSDEDKQYLLVCKNALAKYQKSDGWDAMIISQWLEEKVKQSIPQPKQEWSDEDEELRQFLIKDLEMQDPLPTSIRSDSIKWLKSLRPQNAWKPSDEQIRAIKNAIYDGHTSGIDRENLTLLCEQLKKLKE